MIRAARRWVREDAAFVAVAPCLVGATYTPLGISRIGPLLGSPAFGLGRVYFRTYKALVAYGG